MDGMRISLDGDMDDSTDSPGAPPPQAAQAAHAQLTAVFELCPDGVALFDAEGRVLFTNAACQALWGWDAGLPRPAHMTDFDDQLAACCQPDPLGADLSVAAQRRLVQADPQRAERPVVLRLAHPHSRVVHRHLRLSRPQGGSRCGSTGPPRRPPPPAGAAGV